MQCHFRLRSLSWLLLRLGLASCLDMGGPRVRQRLLVPAFVTRTERSTCRRKAPRPGPFRILPRAEALPLPTSSRTVASSRTSSTADRSFFIFLCFPPQTPLAAPVLRKYYDTSTPSNPNSEANTALLAVCAIDPAFAATSAPKNRRQSAGKPAYHSKAIPL